MTQFVNLLKVNKYRKTIRPFIDRILAPNEDNDFELIYNLYQALRYK